MEKIFFAVIKMHYDYHDCNVRIPCWKAWSDPVYVFATQAEMDAKIVGLNNSLRFAKIAILAQEIFELEDLIETRRKNIKDIDGLTPDQVWIAEQFSTKTVAQKRAYFEQSIISMSKNLLDLETKMIQIKENLTSDETEDLKWIAMRVKMTEIDKIGE